MRGGRRIESRSGQLLQNHSLQFSSQLTGAVFLIYINLNVISISMACTFVHIYCLCLSSPTSVYS